MVYVFFAHGFEEIEAITAVDVLRRADIEVVTVGVGGKSVTGAHGININCDISYHDIENDKFEMIVLPGGMPGTKNLQKSSRVQQALEHAVENDRWVAAICAAPMILGANNMLDNRKATIYKGMQNELGDAEYIDEMVVQDGKFITGSGPAASIQFALKLVEVLKGKSKSEEIGDAM